MLRRLLAAFLTLVTFAMPSGARAETYGYAGIVGPRSFFSQEVAFPGQAVVYDFRSRTSEPVFRLYLGYAYRTEFFHYQDDVLQFADDYITLDEVEADTAIALDHQVFLPADFIDYDGFGGRTEYFHTWVTVAFGIDNLSDNTVHYAVTLSAVPEPATWGAMIVGFALTGGAVRRRRVGVAA